MLLSSVLYVLHFQIPARAFQREVQLISASRGFECEVVLLSLQFAVHRSSAASTLDCDVLLTYRRLMTVRSGR